MNDPEIEEDSDYICSGCVGDQAILAALDAEMRNHACSFCHSSSSNAVALFELAERIDGSLREVYRHGEDQARSDDSDKVYHEQQGEDLVDILEQQLEIDRGAAEALAELLCENDPADIRHGDEPFYSLEQKYERGLASSQPFHEKWEEFEQRLKHSRRFFDAESATLLAEFLGEPNCAARVPLARRAVGPGTEVSCLYRARLASTTAEAHQIFAAPDVQLGPPPPNACRAGRGECQDSCRVSHHAA